MKTDQEISFEFIFEGFKGSYKLICVFFTAGFLLFFLYSQLINNRQYTVQAILNPGMEDGRINLSTYRYFYSDSLEAKEIFNNFKYEKSIADSSVIPGANLIAIEISSDSIDKASMELLDLCRLWISDLKMKRVAQEELLEKELLEKELLLNEFKAKIHSVDNKLFESSTNFLGDLNKVQNEIFKLRTDIRKMKLDAPKIIKYPTPINKGRALLKSISNGLLGGFIGLILSILFLKLKNA